ncbi:MAG: hypothetical protein EOO43_00745 [Flavobacterium sp.]|nr:MAG: hypothetical protein EOO43_00745 [Flavobacterium sp.]
MSLDILEIVKQYKASFKHGIVNVEISARIVKTLDGTFYFETSQLFKELGAAEFYTPGASSSDMEQAEQKLFNYLNKFKYVVIHGGITSGNSYF